MDREQKYWIDTTSYEELLRRWRYGRIGDPLFQGFTGNYYKKIMTKKGDALPVEEKVAISKRVGVGL